jgi:hypothetical protein
MTDDTTEIDKFYAVRKRWIAEHPEWKDEPNAFFMDLYMQTYPARKFPLTMELLEQYEEKKDD